MSTPLDAFRAAVLKPKGGNDEDEVGIQYWQDKLVGKTYIGGGSNGELAEDQVVRDSELPANHRVSRPNSMMTMDYRPTRLNLKVNEHNKIVSVNFG